MNFIAALMDTELTTRDHAEALRAKVDGIPSVVTFRSLKESRRLIDWCMLVLIGCLVWVAATVQSAYLAPWALDHAISPSQLGAILAVPLFANVMAQPLAPMLGRACGHIPLVCVATLLAAVCCALFAFAPQLSPAGTPLFILLCCLQVIGGFAQGVSESTGMTLCQLLFPDAVGQVIGHVEACIGVGCVIGPAVGGIAFAVGGFVAPPLFAAALLCGLAVALCFWERFRRRRVLQSIDSRLDDTGEADSVRRPDSGVFAAAILGIVYFGLIVGGTSPLIAEYYAHDYGLSSASVGAVLGAYGAIYIVTAALAGCWTDRSARSARIAFIVGFFLTSAGTAAIGLPQLPLSIAGFLVISIGEGLCVNGGFVLLVQSKPVSRDESFTSAVFMSAYSGGCGLGRGFLLPLSQAFGVLPVVSLVGALGALCAGIMTIFLAFRPLPVLASSSQPLRYSSGD